MKAKKTGKWVFPVILVLILALTYTAFFGVENYYGDTREITFKGAKDIRWGIDIQGGVEAVFAPNIDDAKITAADMDAAKAIIETRLLDRNITDAEIFLDSNNNQVIVRFPWSSDQTNFDPEEEVAKLGETAMLSFCEGTTYDESKVILKGDEVASASVAPDPENYGQYIINLEFTSSGKAKFADATSRLIGSTISIWLESYDANGELTQNNLSSPTVETAITNGQAYINGFTTTESADYVADRINAGALPFALTPDNSKLQIISPSLGSDALNVMLIAGSIAFGVICLLMIVRYRLPGVIASISLLGQLAAMIACISGYFDGTDSFTLTIPGIAGIILSVGVGVDANVIAAERIKEEFAKGKTIDSAINAGYKNSVGAIIDGNVTIVIVSVVLMGAFGSTDSIIGKVFAPIMNLFGSTITGSVYSFGYTLLIGVVFNLLLGVLASRWMMKSISRYKIFRKPVFFGGAKNV